MAEIQKLTEVLARIVGLKNANKGHEAEELLESAVSANFGLSVDDLGKISTQDFETILHNKQYTSAQLDILAQLLFESVYPFEDVPDTDVMLHKILLIFSLLEDEHHMQSFENLGKREMIDKFLNNRQVE
jgi:hypothetical protein